MRVYLMSPKANGRWYKSFHGRRDARPTTKKSKVGFPRAFGMSRDLVFRTGAARATSETIHPKKPLEQEGHACRVRFRPRRTAGPAQTIGTLLVEPNEISSKTIVTNAPFLDLCGANYRCSNFLN
jgi:hypothetical protein